ncbi:unnamed protein product [Paramecium sonneborni]|uniref:Protein kinase domain-containing protein n=1 Tax=Paramecium sonneborni TaxID=65129 RepID=A0A8S1L7X5_9CILI|nr:unnamed protein product [Paramecium sonneborni]
MSDAVYQHQPFITQTHVQTNNQIKKDKPIITQIIRQPSIPQIRISKNNRSTKYQPTPNKLSYQKQVNLSQLQRDYTSIESTILFSSQICLNEFTLQSQFITPTIFMNQSFIIQEELNFEQQQQEIDDTIIQPTETKLNELTNEEFQIHTNNILKSDEDHNINSLNLKTKSQMFGDLAVLNFIRKKAERNKINQSLQNMLKLNKFKNDHQSSMPTNFPSIGIISLQIQYQEQFNIAVPTNSVKLIQIEKDNFDEQTANKLYFPINILNLSNETQNLRDKPISSKQTNFRIPLKQESKEHTKQSLSFKTKSFYDIQENFTHSFPSESLQFQLIKFDTNCKESNCIKINQSTVQNNEKIIVEAMKFNNKFQLYSLNQDEIDKNQTKIQLSKSIIQEQNMIVQFLEQKKIPIQNLRRYSLIRDFVKDSTKQLRISFNQLMINSEQDSLLSQIPLITQNKINLRSLLQDSCSDVSKIMSEMIPTSFENEVEVQFNDQIQIKEKPQYPTLLEMNRIKIERIKQIITGAKSPKDLKKNNLEVKEEIGQVYGFFKVNAISDGSPKFNHNNVNGIKLFHDINKNNGQIFEKQRSCSIDKATMHMQMSKNQSSVLNRFKKIKYLGRGKMSDVYSVIDQKTGMALALKIIQKSLIKSKGLANLVSNEIKIQMCLVHSNILKCFGVVDDIKQIALILELSDQTLYSLIRRQKLSRRQMINILFQVLNAVNYLHSCDIIHRDIKAENILLCQDVIKLADLGISIRARDSSQYCGTIGYMAPEIKQYKNYTSKVDCYSIGILIFEMMYQKLPTQTLCQIKNIEKDLLIDLMNNLIEPDQENRFSCQEALNHEIFKDFKQNQFAKLELKKEIIRIL